jgi:hypothetical protein
MVAYKNGKLWFGKNGTWMNSGDPAADTGACSTTLSTSKTWVPYFGFNSTWVANFGQRPFAYTPPTGFKALSTANLPVVAIPNPREHHNVYTVTKSGNTNFTLDWDASVYDTYFEIKRRDLAGDWYNVDGLRGYDKILKSNTTGAETTDANVISVSGTTCTLGSTLADGTYVIAAWKAGLTASRQTNTDGSITSTVSRNVVSGFAIVTWTGTGANGTVGFGLGRTPGEVVVKNMDDGAQVWPIWFTGFGSTEYIVLNDTAAKTTSAGVWNSTTPTSTVLSVGTSNATNKSTNRFVAYCFAEITGYSKFGSYVGNGSADGPFVFCGFRPRWILLKMYSGTSTWSWVVIDAARNAYNPADLDLYRH